MVVCERIFAIFLAIIIISSIATTNAYKKHVGNSKYIQSDSSEEQLEHLTEDQPENETNRSIPPTEYCVDVPCDTDHILYENRCIYGRIITINQSLPENKPEDQPENQPKDQAEDEINRTIPPIECGVSVPCKEGFIPFDCGCIPGLIIKIQIISKSNLYINI